ncbi:MAG: hypothetical protein AB1634_13210 [Thermodesulfobacteriota bacterium]
MSSPAFPVQRRFGYDFLLVLATTVVLAVISALCIYSMFAYKTAVGAAALPAARAAHMARMNGLVAPWLIALILILAICVPKRLLPVAWLHRLTGGLAILVVGVSAWHGLPVALLVVIIAATILQLVILALAVTGSPLLRFERKGYWLRVGSASLHLGLLLFLCDLHVVGHPGWHPFLFWAATVSFAVGLTCSFYADALVRLVRQQPASTPGPDPGERA